MNVTKLLAPLFLGLVACGGPIDDGSAELASTESKVITLTTCNEVFTLMSGLAANEPLPVAQVAVVGKFKAASAKVVVNASSSLLSSGGVFHGTFDGDAAVATVQLRKRFQSISGRSFQTSTTLRVSFVDEQRGNTRFDATVVPSECSTRADGSAVVRGVSGDDELTVIFHGEPLPG